MSQHDMTRYREYEPSEPASDQSYSPGGTADSYEPFSTIGARVHARHASVLVVDDVLARGGDKPDTLPDVNVRVDDDDIICMF